MSLDSPPLAPASRAAYPEVEYSSESVVRSPLALLRRGIADVRASREPAWHLFQKTIRSQHRQSVLGYAWILLPPIFTILMWVSLDAMHILPMRTTALPYLLHVLLGSLLWQVFAEAVRCPLQDLRAEKDILTKIRMPHEAVLIAGVGVIVLNFLVRLLLAIPALWYFRIQPSWGALLVPFGCVCILALGLALGLILAPFGLLYSDVSRSIEIAMNFGFMATPVVYPLATVWPGSMLAKVNPLITLLVTTRDWMSGAGFNTMPGFYLISAGAFVSLFLAWIFYRIAAPHVMARL